jgi:cell shape-determining protein MreC
VAAFATGATRSLPQRGPAPGLRFFIYAVLAVTLMVLDQRGGWLERVRYGLQAAAYPLQLAMNSPSAAWNWTSRIFEARAALQAENAGLREANRRLRLANLRAACARGFPASPRSGCLPR